MLRRISLAVMLMACGSFAAEDAPSGAADSGPVVPESEAGPGPGDADAAPIDQDADLTCALGDAGRGVLCEGACIDVGNDRDHCGGCDVACPATAACEAGACVDVVPAPTLFRVESPCVKDSSGDLCVRAIQARIVTSAVLAGTAGRTYALLVRVRGVVEQKKYDGAAPGLASGTGAEGFVEIAKENRGAWNQIALEVDAPHRLLALNAGEETVLRAFAVDYTTTLVVKARAKLFLSMDSTDSSQVRNHDADNRPIVVPVIEPAPEPFDGQFVQLDVLSVTPAP